MATERLNNGEEYNSRSLNLNQRASEGMSLLLAYKAELKRAPEIPEALHSAYFDTLTPAHTDLQKGKVTFRRGNSVYEVTNITSSQNTELIVTKYPPVEDTDTIEVQEEIGIKIMHSHDGRIVFADIRYNHLFSPLSSNSQVIETNTFASVDLLYKFLGIFHR